MEKKFSRSFAEISNIVAMREQFFSEQNIEPDLRHIVDLAVEELFVNMVTYDTETLKDILIEMQPHEHGVEISLTDFDVERFDPTGIAPVDIEAPLEKRTPGGLGLYLVLKMVDSIHYQYRNGQSKITFIVDRK